MRRLLLLIAGAALLTACSTGATNAPATILPVDMAPPATAVATPLAAPIRIELPALKVADDVVPVALDKAGDMELPPVTQVGWYRLAVMPGDIGRAVLAGHVNYNGRPGAFEHLGALRSGDQVRITDANGVLRIFAVYAVRQVHKADYARTTVPLIFDGTMMREVALVTCSGTVVDHEYDSNTIALARQT
jgi:LPXTG-site transpeptidase (sortase) family protein